MNNRRPFGQCLLPLLLLIAAATTLPAQGPQQEQKYQISASLTAGYGFRISSSPPPQLPELEETSGGVSGVIRLMWCPEHLLRVGMDVGYLPVSGMHAKNEDSRQGSANLSLVSWPVMGVVAMEKYGVDLSAGIGMILLRVEGKAANGEQIHSEGWEIGYTFGAGYTWHYSERLGIGADLKMVEFTDRPIGSLIAGLRVRWALLEY
ncbi:MAG: hypothetical protein IPM61_01320 [Chlorobi bacterium]|nr:MAG: hypothetical protein UZ07_CHB004001974 [Chlorobi bacterium OLB7]MBK8909946.1 hypothetical protein [Chlorobiota bacterium]MCE7935066.1 hypothetical protein [Chlorobi bacterium CHB2]